MRTELETLKQSRVHSSPFGTYMGLNGFPRSSTGRILRTNSKSTFTLKLAHPGGPVKTNKAAALAKYLERKLQQPDGLKSINPDLVELAVKNAKETVKASSMPSTSGRNVRHVAYFEDSSESSGNEDKGVVIDNKKRRREKEKVLVASFCDLFSKNLEYHQNCLLSYGVINIFPDSSDTKEPGKETKKRHKKKKKKDKKKKEGNMRNKSTS